MATIQSTDANGQQWMQYTSQGPKFRVKLHYGRTKSENHLMVWRGDGSRALEFGEYGDVQSCIYAWTMQEWKRPQWQVHVHSTLQYTRASNGWIEVEWSKERAEETRKRLQAKHPDRAVTVREVPWEEYSKENN